MEMKINLVIEFLLCFPIWDLFSYARGDEFIDYVNDITHHNSISSNFTKGRPLSSGEKHLAKSLSWTKYYSQPFEMDHHSSFFEGDIILDQRQKRRNDGGFMGEMFKAKIRWPNGIVPYVIENTYSGKERLLLARAIEEIESVSCVKFLPRSYQTDFVYIHKGKNCASSVGRIGGGQSLSLTENCLFFGIILHELMHVLGFWHEHSRYDRSKYVNIHWKNINPRQMNNFFINPSYILSDVGLPYDYSSILHYGPLTFAKDSYHPSITPKRKGPPIGQRVRLSKLNIEAINRLYKCRRRRGANVYRRPHKAPRFLEDHYHSHPHMPPPRCLDVNWSCPMARIMGWCTFAKPIMAKTCRRTCGFCKIKPTWKL